MPRYNVVVFLPEGGTIIIEKNASTMRRLIKDLKFLYPDAVFLPLCGGKKNDNSECNSETGST